MTKLKTCYGCVYARAFRARADERERYGFDETGFSCDHPIDGGVYVLDPDEPTCLHGPYPRGGQSA